MKLLGFEFDLEKKDIIIYSGIALICLLISAALFFFLYQRQEARRDYVNQQIAVADSLAAAQAEADSLLAMAETEASAKAADEQSRPMFDIDNPDLTEEERAILRMQQYFYNLKYGEPEPPEAIVEVVVESPVLDYRALLDSTIVIMNAQIDSLQHIISTNNENNDLLKSSIVYKDGQIVDLGDAIAKLDARIRELRAEIERLNQPPPPPPPPPPAEPTKEPDYRQVAKIYNNMDAKKVASLMQEMSAERSVRILKAMNQRKKSQVMAALPPGVATRYARLLMDI